jgi:opacity protein-like surface antigen
MHPRRAILLSCGLVAGCALGTATHADAPGDRSAPPVTTTTEKTSRIPAFLRPAKPRRGEPEWLHRLDVDRAERTTAGEGDIYLTLQDDRRDGYDLLTARYTLHDARALRTYAGAGLNRAQYFHDDPGNPGPTWFNKRNRRTSVGAAAELGAEVQVSSRMRLNADLRWIDLDSRAEALRTDNGPIVADPLMLGVEVGYRFR